MSRTFLILHRDSLFCAYLFHVVFMDILYYNTPIYSEILLKFLQITEKYYVNRTPFHFRRRAEAVLRRAFKDAFQRRSAWLVLTRLKNGFIRQSELCSMKKIWHASAQHGRLKYTLVKSV